MMTIEVSLFLQNHNLMQKRAQIFEHLTG
jgi:hypothetical protein